MIFLSQFGMCTCLLVLVIVSPLSGKPLIKYIMTRTNRNIKIQLYSKMISVPTKATTTAADLPTDRYTAPVSGKIVVSFARNSNVSPGLGDAANLFVNDVNKCNVASEGQWKMLSVDVNAGDTVCGTNGVYSTWGKFFLVSHTPIPEE